MTTHSNDNQPNLNDLANIQNENISIFATCDLIIEAIFEMGNRIGAEDDFHIETTERIIMQLYDMKIEAENMILTARLGVLKENLME
ncbi:hypothetical protein [Paenibacillus sp. LjRoot56]|uniref:hypothetical protein n=1 Tax=Paenibacillus sp. LjRoot56 TaxID=3342333 RepID=UPI003ECC4FB4